MEREMAVNLLWEAERKAERAEAELLQCRTILDLAGDHSTSIHSGIDSLVAQRHSLQKELEEDEGVIKVWRRRTYEAEDRVELLESAIQESIETFDSPAVEDE